MRSAQPLRFLAVLTAISSQLFANSGSLRIHESTMTAGITDKEITVTAPVLNDSGAAIAATVYIELLDSKDTVVAATKTSETLKPGTTSLKFVLARPVVSPTAENDPLLWYRVRYHLESDGKQLSHGIVALGAIAPDMFELRVAHAEKVLPDESYRVRIHAAHPVTRRPVNGVEVRGELGFDSADKSVVLTQSTNLSGDAVLQFHIPASASSGGSVEIQAQKRDQLRKENFDFDLDPRVHIIINTDKLLYQPGQSLHARVLVLGVDQHAIANEDAEFRLLDPESNTVFSSTAKTNEFGIANVDWELSDSTELGPYALQVSLANSGRYSNAQGVTNVRVSRYDLPNFTVSAKLDRAYYLPGQSSSVEISAKYLFGKELTPGTVKLVREEQGHWDSTLHKWVVDETEHQSGELDRSGRATFTLDFHRATGRTCARYI